MLEEERMTAKQPNLDHKERFRIFPTEKCRRLVDRYKQLYKLGTEKKAQRFYLYHIVLDGFTAAYWFYELCYTLDLENEPVAGEFKNVCIMFARAAAGLGKLLGEEYVDVNEWKKRHNFDKYFMDDITDSDAASGRSGWALASPGLGVTVNPIQIKGVGTGSMYTIRLPETPQPPQAAVYVQGQEPLTASMLAQAPPSEQKQMLGERLLPFIQGLVPDMAGKITGMLLEIDNSELLHMLEHKESLSSKVKEAVAVLSAQETTPE
jgi:hypothetical protein